MTNNQQQLEQLENLLSQQLEAYQMVARKLHEKNSVLVHGHYGELPTLDQELIALGRKTAQLEQARMELLVGMGHTDKTLTQVISGLNTTDARRLAPLRDNLRGVIEDIHETNERSRGMLNLSIQWVSQTVEIIARALAPESASYTSAGGRTNAKQESANPINVHSTVIRDA